MAWGSALVRAGRDLDARDVMVRGLEALPAAPSALRAWLELELARAVGAHEDWEQVRGCVAWARAMTPALAREGAAPAAYTLGFLALEFGDLDTADSAYSEALRWHTAHGPARSQLMGLLPAIAALARATARPRGARCDTPPTDRRARSSAARTPWTSGGRACWPRTDPQPKTADAPRCSPCTPWESPWRCRCGPCSRWRWHCRGGRRTPRSSCRRPRDGPPAPTGSRSGTFAAACVATIAGPPVAAASLPDPDQRMSVHARVGLAVLARLRDPPR